MVAGPPLPAPSTPSSVADAWLICSWNCESTFATARAMRWWFRRTFSCVGFERDRGHRDGQPGRGRRRREWEWGCREPFGDP